VRGCTNRAGLRGKESGEGRRRALGGPDWPNGQMKKGIQASFYFSFILNFLISFSFIFSFGFKFKHILNSNLNIANMRIKKEQSRLSMLQHFMSPIDFNTLEEIA
jgi:hypothetical protein